MVSPPSKRIKTDVGGTSQRNANDLKAMVWQKQANCQSPIFALCLIMSIHTQVDMQVIFFCSADVGIIYIFVDVEPYTSLNSSAVSSGGSLRYASILGGKMRPYQAMHLMIYTQGSQKTAIIG